MLYAHELTPQQRHQEIVCLLAGAVVRWHRARQRKDLFICSADGDSGDTSLEVPRPVSLNGRTGEGSPDERP
ncbi:hypothetical protein Mal4_40530 [Maioricimonas rarisocia]|uniref:Uncharacterized protein n=1 Tax=Maioricimonas rarisocia TaxID=2528026 RepID=A0A517ZB68_9PLAN|nr:hypothetical protein [Maioricimonas rarisocia]QDU39707.1 hypothetical protein Mal4_40530 [Maioricimonas rarisocia]